MKTLLRPLLLIVASAVTARAGDFTRGSSFRSVSDFAAAAKAFQPAQSGSDLAKLFTIKEDVYAPATAESVDAVEVVYDGDNQAMVFVSAQPPTQNTLWKVGVLFVLVQSHGHWHISDSRQFNAIFRSTKPLKSLANSLRAPKPNRLSPSPSRKGGVTGHTS